MKPEHMLTGRNIRLAAFFLNLEIERRRQEHSPIPPALTETANALLSAAGQLTHQHNTNNETLISTTELAATTGKSDRTIRRWAARRNLPKVAGRCIINQETQ